MYVKLTFISNSRRSARVLAHLSTVDSAYHRITHAGVSQSHETTQLSTFTSRDLNAKL